MQNLTLEQTADYLESAIIESTNLGHVIINTGKSAAGIAFVLVKNVLVKPF